MNCFDLPASLQVPRTQRPIRQSNSSIKVCHERGDRREIKMKASQKLLVDAHLRHSIGKLQDISIENLSG